MQLTPRRTLLPLLLAAFGMTAACETAPADDATTTTDSTAAVSDIQPPAELQTTAAQYLATWNQEDAPTLAAFFTEDAVVHDDTLTFTGRPEIEGWMKEALPVISDLEISDEKWTQAGADYVVNGRYKMKIAMEDHAMDAAGTYDETWTQGADGNWRVRLMNTKPDAAPPPPPTTTTGQ